MIGCHATCIAQLLTTALIGTTSTLSQHFVHITYDIMEEQAYIPLISYRSKLARYPRPWTVNFELHDVTLRWCKAHVTL